MSYSTAAAPIFPIVCQSSKLWYLIPRTTVTLPQLNIGLNQMSKNQSSLEVRKTIEYSKIELVLLSSVC